MTVVAASVILPPSTPMTADAQIQSQPITLIGYFDRERIDEPSITREIQVSKDGIYRRGFGIVEAQSVVATAAADVFRATLRPVVLIRGRDEMIAKLDAAKPDQKVRMVGMFNVRNSSLTLTEVEVSPSPTAK